MNHYGPGSRVCFGTLRTNFADTFASKFADIHKKKKYDEMRSRVKPEEIEKILTQ